MEEKPIKEWEPDNMSGKSDFLVVFFSKKVLK